MEELFIGEEELKGLLQGCATDDEEEEVLAKFVAFIIKKKITWNLLLTTEKEGELKEFLMEDAGLTNRVLRTKVMTLLRTRLTNLKEGTTTQPQPTQPQTQPTTENEPLQNNQKLVCVTGATGYIACHVVEQFLKEGFRVRGTVRSKDPAKVKHLLAIQEKVGGDLELFEADLNKEFSFNSAFKDVDYIMHVASPFVVTVQDPQKDLVDPAVLGTLSVLRAAAFSPSVKRIVLTSSMAAITDSPDRILTEEIWNEKSNLKRNPYYYSKVLAEKAAWKYVEENKPGYDLVTICPHFVWGPSHAPSPNESLKVLASFLSGEFPMIMNIDFGFVDVRDVARAHYQATITPSASGRYICFGKKKSMRQIVEILKGLVDPKYAKGLPSVGLDSSGGDVLIKVLANFEERGVKDFIQLQVGKTLKWKSDKIEKELGIEWTDEMATFKDSVDYLIQNGAVKEVKK
eukprot:TRINITY_DN806_c0_g1_i1.p1 TRINITY_DN806_c0_g1~~TRINITY_DN806_c0_g1_i1.p1  ORF type:complete len:476 (-),score=143.48 TRINITY_DN806_c0_g1_i1:37-1410(-)